MLRALAITVEQDAHDNAADYLYTRVDDLPIDQQARAIRTIRSVGKELAAELRRRADRLNQEKGDA